MRPDSFSLNPYEVLGVPSKASIAEIQTAYRHHALRWHPDRNPNDEYAMRMMQRVNAAWAILKDEDSRSAYDLWERGETRPASGPQAWRRPRADSAHGREWYRPPPVVLSCPRCDSTNEASSDCCYSCGYSFDEARSQPGQSAGGFHAEYRADELSRYVHHGGFQIRLVAFFIDAIAVFLVVAVLLSVIDTPITNWFTVIYWTEITLGAPYFALLVGSWSSTLGKRLFGLSVVRLDGSKVGYGRAFGRYLCYSLSFWTFGIGFLMILFRNDKRGLHDLICDTKVVYR